MKWTRSVRGSVSRDTVSPLTVTEISKSCLLVECARRRGAQRALGQHPREVALVVDRSATVGAGRAVGRGDFAGLFENLVRGRAAPQEILGALQVDRRHPERAERDADV